jgi:hypothetical protein
MACTFAGKAMGLSRPAVASNTSTGGVASASSRLGRQRVLPEEPKVKYTGIRPPKTNSGKCDEAKRIS